MPLAFDLGRDALFRDDARQMAVVIVFVAVQRRHVDARHVNSQEAQQVVAVKLLGLPFVVGVEELVDEVFSFADHDHVDKGRERFGIEKGHRPAHDDERIVILAVFSEDRDAPHFEDRRHIEIVHLEADGQAENLEIRKGPPVFQGNDGFLRLFEDLHQLLVRQESPFAEPVFAAVHFAVYDLHAQIAHGHVIRIGIADGHGVPRPERIAHSPRFLSHQFIQCFLYLPAHVSSCCKNRSS